MFPITVDSARSTSPAAPAPALKGETRIQDPGRSGQAIARRAAEARATVPDLELEMTVDAQPMIDLARTCGCSHTAVLVRACALALRDSPYANAAYRDGRYELYSRVNIAVTVVTGDGQLTPTVLDADTKSLGEISEEIERLAHRARSGELTPPEQAGATFTVSDLGALGVHRWSLPVTPPQAAALTAGAVREAAVVRDGRLVAGYERQIALACDHRILFGARAAGLLTRVAQLLETVTP
jgi:pyruvate dehydrogenase E2 component (dihydrolipoamide acetyltransferase)